MANYFGRFSKVFATGCIAGSGVLVACYGIYHSDKFKVYARNSPHLIAIHKWDANWDRRNPASMVEEKGILETDKDYETELQKHIPKHKRNLFLIRHGQYNVEGESDKDRYLTPLGRRQAELTGLRLKSMNYPFSSVTKSTMLRAQETAEVILDNLEGLDIKQIKNCNLLEEGAPIPPEPPVGHWKPEAYQFYQDGPRIEAAFRKYVHRADPSQAEDSYEIIVAHSNVIRYFICRALQFPPDAWLRFTLHHCSITWLVITPTGRVVVRGVGDTGHIPPDAVTSH